MMQFLKSILSRGDKARDQQKEIDELRAQIEYMEKRMTVMTEAISELSVGLTNVGTASRMLAQDVSTLTILLESIQTAVTPDDRLKFTWHTDDDGDDYLN